ncbi:histidine kinase [bacterium]|nr:histidine kinase [bacterium]
MEALDDIIKEFLVESYENLDQLDRDLLALEDTPDDRDCLASVFRTVHTIKGTSGFLALPKLERVAHVGENLLVPLRDGALQHSHEIADGLLAMVDAIREILGHIESDGVEGDGEYDALIARLDTLLKTGVGEPDVSTDGSSATSLSDEELSDVVTSLAEAKASSAATDSSAAAASKADNSARGKQRKPKAPRRRQARTGKRSTDQAELTAPVKATVDAARPDAVEAVAPEAGVAAASVVKTPTEAVVAAQTPAGPKAADATGTPKSNDNPDSANASGAAATAIADSTVRIDVGLLDRLMNLVGELVLARNQILQFTSVSGDATLAAASQRLNLITTELQEGVMKTRMQPIRNAWSKLPRVVRDLSTACGKQVKVEMEGADTELDKTILEAIKDPLTHIVRNSVDHGIESPDVRVANGKPAEGTLLLRAFHEGGQVNIEIIDDGGGINIDRVRDKAVEKGLITTEQAATLSDREATNLILLPGFSTAQKVTNVSGRGVGMDVVKTNIERISGTLEIQSVPGGGTTLRIRIPLTLAIVPALIIQTQGDQYAIPQVSLRELVRLDGSRAKQEIEFIHDAPVYRLRGRLLPLVYLDEQLELRSKRRRDEHNAAVNIVVLQAEDRQFGLIVDSVMDTQEIVVKPLGQHLKGTSAYAGATIMGDGSVALILDVLGLAQKSSILSEGHHDQAVRADGNRTARDSVAESQSLLVVDPGDGARVALRLSTVARLEEFRASDIERTGHSDVVQYRGQIMPLIQMAAAGFDAACGEDDQRMPVVVFTSGRHSVGIVVGRIIDIVQHTLTETDDTALPGRHVIQGRVTELIDLEQYVRETCPQIFHDSFV